MSAYQTLKPDLPSAPHAALDDDDLCMILARSEGYYRLGLFAEADAELDEANIPPESRARLLPLRCMIARAAGDPLKVVAHGHAPALEGTPAPRVYALVAAALNERGDSEAALTVTRKKIEKCGGTPGDRYDLACFNCRAGHFREALCELRTSLHNDLQRQSKALIDSDLQPLWARLPHEPLSAEIAAALRDPVFNVVAGLNPKCALREPWDAADRHALPAAFGRWMVYNPQIVGMEMNPAAPERLRRGFKRWTVARARSSQRLLRRALRRVQFLRLNPANYAAFSDEPKPGFALSERNFRQLFDSLCRLRDSAPTAADRSVWQDEINDLTHSRQMETMVEKGAEGQTGDCR